MALVDPYGSDIRRARDILERILKIEGLPLLAAKGIRLAIDLMYRRVPVRKAERRMPRLTEALKLRVLRNATMFPEEPESEIASRSGLGSQAGGRVSEIIRGLR